MSEADAGDELVPAPSFAPLLERASVPWLASLRERLEQLQGLGRLPHGILLGGDPGAGQVEIAAWLAALLLCRAPDRRPCGRCADCRLFLAGSHPDLRWLSPPPDKKEIGIGQVRAMSDALSMRSYRGGAKVAVIAPIELMNAKSYNALLKTLEEPAADTYLVLAGSRVDRVPKTIMSRCMRLGLALPGKQEALAWLDRRRPRQDWAELLALASGAPFLALEHADAGLDGLDAEMQAALDAAIAGRLDFVAFADACAKNSPAARLAWLESWLTRSLKEAAVASDLVNNNRLPWLRPPGIDTKIRAGYGLLDRLRDARRLLGGNLNTQLLFEGLLIALAAVVGRAGRQAGERSG